ncbi:MAG: AbgT family transporter, partial [Candidatus Hydrogenedentota bacterium]
DAGNTDTALTPIEKRGLRGAAIAVAICLAALLWMTLPANAIFRDETGQLMPLLNSLVPLMLILFFIPGLVYGRLTGSIKTEKQAVAMTSETMSSMGGYIVLAFVAAQFVAYFEWSRLGSILAIQGAAFLDGLGVRGIPLLLGFILVSAFINLFVGSASAKWAIMAPVFVPMFMLMGYSPELTQATYRIGDSFTNIITPILPYFPLIIVSARRYSPNAGIGTVISMMTPYSVGFGLIGTAVLLLWVLLGLPLGPGAPLHYP